MVNWNRHTKHRYLTFQLQKHNTRRKKEHKVLIVESKGAKARRCLRHVLMIGEECRRQGTQGSQFYKVL